MPQQIRRRQRVSLMLVGLGRNITFSFMCYSATSGVFPHNNAPCDLRYTRGVPETQDVGPNRTSRGAARIAQHPQRGYFTTWLITPGVLALAQPSGWVKLACLCSDSLSQGLQFFP